MSKLISIDPGKNKCGLVLAEINKKIVYRAIIINSELLENYVKNLDKAEGLLILIAGITLLTNNDNNNISYYTNPLNDNSLLNLSIKF